MTKMVEKKDRAGEIFASIILGWLVFIVLGTLTGVWVKLFWLGWVLR